MFAVHVLMYIIAAPPRPTRPPMVNPAATKQPPVAKAHSKPVASEQTANRSVFPK